VWSKRVAALASSLVLAVSAGCGQPAGAKAGAKAGARPAQVAHRLEAIDLLPRDLDIVVRIDVARLKAGLGPGVAERFAARAAEQGGEGFVSEAIAKADAVWIGMRLADIDAGDRVLVAEGRLGEIHIEPKEWMETTPAATNEGVRIIDRKGITARNGTGRMVVVKDKLYAFISPVEVDATSRLLRDGPDEGRGDPSADGLISVDVRGHRLPPSLEKRYPSIAAVIAGVVRVRGSATLADGGLLVNIDLTAKSAEAAQRVEKFLVTLRDNVSDPKYAGLMQTVKIERVDTHLHVRTTIPAPMVIAALSGAE